MATRKNFTKEFSLKNELVHFYNFNTGEEAKTAIFDYTEIFYNRQRLHETLDYVSPVEFERREGVSQIAVHLIGASSAKRWPKTVDPISLVFTG